MIGVVHGELSVEAQYNPADLQRDKPVTWAAHGGVGAAGNAKGPLALEFPGAEPRTMTLALLFDSYEQNASIEPVVEKLELLATPTDPTSTDEVLSSSRYRRSRRCSALSVCRCARRAR